MGFHATIAAGRDAFGNERHKVAPRVLASPRVTGTSQVQKFHELAGNIVSFPGIDGVTHDATTRAEALRAMLARRKVTHMTYVASDWRKDTATRWSLTMRALDGRMTARKVANKSFNGWIVFFETFTGVKIELARVAKGQSIEHNGERADACRAGMNVLHVALASLR